jgi:phosphatidylglycerophosphate synthase
MKYLAKQILALKTMVTTPKGIVITIPTIAIAFSQEQKAGWLLALLFLFDFITGLGASYIEKKKAEKTNPELIKQNLISSEKGKMCLVKFMLYGGSILIAKLLTIVFLVKPFLFDYFEKSLSLTLLVIMACSLVELYSILFENFKRMGLDIYGGASKLIDKFIKLKAKL